MRKIIFPFLTVLMASLSFAQDSIFIDIMVRDFPSGHPDFENFNSKKPPAETTIEDCGSLLQPELVDQAVRDGYLATLDATIGIPSWGGNPPTTDSRDIYPTFGMVALTLSDDGKPMKARQACDNTYLNDWFSSNQTALTPGGVPFTVFEVPDVIGLSLVEGTSNTYEAKFLYQDDNGYFPLDKHASLAPNDGISPLDPSIITWGKQNDGSWCNSRLIDSCTPISDNNSGIVNPYATGAKAHNYGYTVQGKMEFSYRGQGANEIFTFQGDDDMWIFIDGILEVDLGGTHLATTQTIDLGVLAAKHNWSLNSTHTMDFFYAERQTDGANLILTVTLNDIVPSKNRSPYITRMEKVIGTDDYYIFMNVNLHENTIAQASSIQNMFSVLTLQGDQIGSSFTIKSIESIDVEADERKYGVKYKVTFNNDGVTSLNGPEVEHTVSFNTTEGIPFPSEGIPAYAGSSIAIMGSNDLVVDKHVYQSVVGIQSSTGSNETLEPDDKVVYEPYDIDKLTEIYPDEIPKDEGVDLKNTVIQLPDGLFGQQVNTENLQTYLAEQIATGTGNPTVNLTGSTAVPSASICGVGDCAGFEVIVNGPYIMNFQIYDHLGQFIRNYQKAVGAEEMARLYGTDWTDNCVNGEGAVVAGDALSLSSDCKPVIANPYILVRPEIPPVDQTGRLIGNGPILIQLDLIEFPPIACWTKNDVGDAYCPDNFKPARTVKILKYGYFRNNGDIVVP